MTIGHGLSIAGYSFPAALPSILQFFFVAPLQTLGALKWGANRAPRSS